MKLSGHFKSFFSLAALLLFNTLLFVAAATFLPLLFETVDDSYFCIIANGIFTGQPDLHLVFVNAIYGSLLVALYNLTSAVEWYTVLYSVFHILAATFIVASIWKDSDMHKWLKITFILFFYALWIQLIVNFQFTTTAGLICFSGILALLNKNTKWRIAGVLAILLASFVRFHAAALTGLLLMPVIIKKLYEERRLAYWLTALIVLVIAGRWADGLYYKTPEWQEFKSYNKYRSQIQDDPYSNERKVILPDNVSEDDYYAYVHFMGDPNIMNLPALEYIISHRSSPSIKQIIRTSITQLRRFMVPLALLFAGFVLGLLLNCASARNKRNTRTLLMLVSTLTIFLLVVGYLSTTSIFTARVFRCLVLPGVYVMTKSQPTNNESKGLFRYAVILLAVVISTIALYYVRRDYKDCRDNNLLLDKYNTDLFPLYSDLEGTIYADGLDFFNPFTLKDLPFSIIRLGWIASLPTIKVKFQGYPDFLNENILCISGSDSPQELICRGLRDDYGINASVMPINQNDSYAVYKFILENQ